MTAQPRPQHRHVERLEDVVVGAELEASDDVRGVAPGADDHDRGALPRADPPQDDLTVLLAEDQIEQDQAIRLAHGQRLRLRAALRHGDRMPLALDEPRQQVLRHHLVFDDEDPRSRVGRISSSAR